MVVAVVSVVLNAGIAAAEHGGPVVHAFPPSGGVLPPNGRIVLISINGQDSAMPATAAKGLALVSDGQPTVKLDVIEAHDDPDGYGEASSVLVPRQRLVPGARYQLGWPGSSYHFAWTVGKRSDKSRPTWDSQPVVEIARDDVGSGYPGSPLVRVRAHDDSKHLALRVTLCSGDKKVVRTAIWDFSSYDSCAFTGYLAVNMKLPLRVRVELVDVAGRKSAARAKLVFAKDSSAYLCRVR